MMPLLMGYTQPIVTVPLSHTTSVTTSEDLTTQLMRIARALETPPTNSLWPTLIATMIGAIAALAGSLLLESLRHKREKRQRYEDRLDGAFYDLFKQLSDRMEALASTHHASPNPPYLLHATANRIRVTARGTDSEAAKELQYAIDRISDQSPGNDLRDLRVVGQIVRAWREGSHDAAKAAERLRGLAKPHQ